MAGELRHSFEAPVQPDTRYDSNTDGDPFDDRNPQICVTRRETGVAEGVGGLGRKLDNGHDSGNDEVQKYSCVPSSVEGVRCWQGIEVLKALAGRMIRSDEVAEEKEDGPNAERFVEVADWDEVW